MQIEVNAEQPLRITRISVAATFAAAVATNTGQQCMHAFLSGSAGAASPGPPAKTTPSATKSPATQLQAFFQAGASPPSRRALPFSGSPEGAPKLPGPASQPRTAANAAGHPPVDTPPPRPPSATQEPPRTDRSNSVPRPGPMLQPGAVAAANDSGAAIGAPCDKRRPEPHTCAAQLPATAGPRAPAAAPGSHACQLPFAETPLDTGAGATCPDGAGDDVAAAQDSAGRTPQPCREAVGGGAWLAPGAPVAGPASHGGGGTDCSTCMRTPPAASDGSAGQAWPSNAPPVAAARCSGEMPVATVATDPPDGVATLQCGSAPLERPSHDGGGLRATPATAAAAYASMEDAALEAPLADSLAGTRGDSGASVPGASADAEAPAVRAAAAAPEPAGGDHAVLEDAVRRTHMQSLCGDRLDLDVRLALRLQEEELRAQKRARPAGAAGGQSAPRAPKGAPSICMLLRGPAYGSVGFRTGCRGRSRPADVLADARLRGKSPAGGLQEASPLRLGP